MKRIVLLSILLCISTSVYAHSSDEEPTEAEYIEATLRQELGMYLESAHMLSNTILGNTITTTKKCEYIEQLKLLLINYNVSMDEYARFARIEKIQGFGSYNGDDTDQSFLKMMFVEQHRSEWIHFNAATRIFDSNLSCK